MGKIIVLDELTASQIAAGEVIERPASVVKETVENSIDAGATNISIEIRAGGIKYIRITDNGSGFEADDAVIAFDKHATSKIRSGGDLNDIHTLGFRGEALASIAAVADVELLSRTENDQQGVYVHVRGGDVLECSNRGSPKGTVLTIKDLFYNVPARYKFLKRDQTEAGYVAETVEKLALSNPGIAFRLISNGQELIRTPGSGLESAVFSIFGRESMKDLLNVAYTDGENTVSGYTGVRGNIFGTRSRQYFFVNGRPVKSLVIASAVDEAYRTVTMKHQFPMCILMISVPSSKLDVNVHPAKTEVRFASERSVFTSVMNAVKNALLSENRTPEKIPYVSPENERKENNDFSTSGPRETLSGAVSFVEKPVENSKNMWKSPVEKGENQQIGLDLTGREPISTLPKAPENINHESNENRPENKPENGPEKAPENIPAIVREQTAETLPPAPPSEVKEQSEGLTEKAEEVLSGTYNETEVFTQSRIIGQYLRTYILLEYNGELVIIDQHAAHERIKYEAICEALDRADASMPVSPMLIPADVRLSPAEKLWLDENMESFTAIGFEIDDFGPDTVLIRAVPSALSEADPEDLLLSGIRAAMSSKGDARSVFRLEAVDTMACKAAVKANQALSTDEIKGLLASLAALKNSATCPHGRPIVVKLTSHELEKRFRRCL
ncbi:MAG: DNA mismatch repair endonuclease MutL [Clostridia bacterium]|nr:DNA mismatch repair endonuclease MutL [Clostridia bacterium]